MNSTQSMKPADSSMISDQSINPTHLSDEDLLIKLKSAVSQERKARQDVLYLLKEVQSRQIHLKRGYSSLFTFLTQECSYSEGAAQRRILAIRLINSLGPELGQKLENDLETGSLSLATISAAQSAFNQIPQNKAMTAQSKMQLLDELKGKSRDEIQRKIAEVVPSVGEKLSERRRVISSDLTELRIFVNHETLEKLDELRERLAHGLKDSRSYSELLDHLATMALKKLNQREKKAVTYLQEKERFLKTEESASQGQVLNTDPLKEKSYLNFTNENSKEKTHFASKQSKLDQSKPKPDPDLHSSSSTKSRYIPSAIRKIVLARDQYCCSYKDPLTGRICRSRFKLQLDHEIPFAIGGSNTESNLRARCQAHNLFHAAEFFEAAVDGTSNG